MLRTRLIYGTAWKKTRTESLVRQAIGQGFRAIDTACQPRHYDEAGVGAGVAASLGKELARGALYLQTKFTPLSGQDPTRIPYDSRAPLPEQVAQSFQRSLQNLRTDYLDCLVLHSPLASPAQTAQVWAALETIADTGGARQIGISNCYDVEYFAALYRAARVKPRVLQNRFYADTGYDREIRAFCREHGVVYQSFWTLTANPHVLSNCVVVDIGARYQRTPAQVLFRYLTQRDVVPLTGTASVVHMQEDLAIFDFELTDAECIAMDALFA